MKLTIAVCIGMLVWGVAVPTNAQVQTARFTSVNVNCKAYYEYLPAGYQNTRDNYPVLIFLHGLGERGAGTPTTITNVLRHGPPRLINQRQWPDSFFVGGKKHQFIVISPQHINWPTPGDVDTLISFLIANYRVDRSRIYLTGLSMGGGVAWNYVGSNNGFARRVAGIVPICGASSPSVTRSNIIAANNLPVWATHNEGDPTAPVAYTNNYITYINGAPKPPNPLARKTIFAVSGHDAWTRTYTPSFRENNLNVYEWMLQYSRRFTNTWRATTSTVWESTANWTEGLLPDANTDVFINSGNVVIKSNVVIRSLTVAPGASVRVQAGYTLTVLQ